MDYHGIIKDYFQQVMMEKYITGMFRVENS